MFHIVNAGGDHGDMLSGPPSAYTFDAAQNSLPTPSQKDRMPYEVRNVGRSSSMSEDSQFSPREEVTNNDPKRVGHECPMLAMPAQHCKETTEGHDSAETHSIAISSSKQLPNTGHTTRPPFQKWLQALQRRRHIKRQRAASLAQLTNDMESSVHSTNGSMNPNLSGDYCGFSSSTSSFAFVSAAREASVSLASMSLKDPSWQQTQRSSRGLSRTDRSSRASYSVRHSEDSQMNNAKQQQLMDSAVLQRSKHRRQVLEELVKTEEGYICDVRFLMSAYFTILASSHKGEVALRSCISHSLTDIVQLHEEILEDLHKLVPDADHTAARPATAGGFVSSRHHRWQSLDAVPEHKTGEPCQQQSLAVVAEPSTAAEVAKVFARKISRFYVYEEYGAKYNATTRDLEAAFRSMSNWETNQRGLETLAHCLDSARDATASHKAMAIGDLLAKPIQRLCRYPLLFSELLKCTPVYDSPEAHLEIEHTMACLRDVTSAMNQATNDKKAPVEKTKLLQDRLVFSNQKPDAPSKSRIRAFGHIQLCGVLYVCWQTRTSVQGKYMVCLLYRNWLCLAIAEKTDRQYAIEACVPLDCCSIEETDNRRGLQCHTTPFAWKIVFECKSQLYEFIMAACSPKEDWEWRDRLTRRIESDACTHPDVSDTAFLALDVKSFGTIFEKPGTVARQLSIRRAATVGSKSQLCQVIIQNTSSVKYSADVSPKKACINRSRSLQNSSRIPVLAPPRAERARLEALVSDVWTRDILPFPGLSARSKREHHVRSSASSLIQRISASSLASTFGKRSIGRAGLPKAMAGASTEIPSLSKVFPPDSSTTDDSITLHEEQVAVFGHEENDAYPPVIRAASLPLDLPSQLPPSAERSREWLKRGQSASHLEQKGSRTGSLSGRKARGGTSDSSQLNGSLRRTLARIFEESKRYECEMEERRCAFDKECSNTANDSPAWLARTASQDRHTLPARRPVAMRPTVLTESMRSASTASICTDVSRPSTLHSTQTSVFEALAPLTRQKRHASPSSPCAKRPVLVRGSIRKSIRNLVH